MIPTSVDCIILGTGLTNSILAAACSRIGKSVLHVDKNNYYGDEWASFTFQQTIDWIKANFPFDRALKTIPEELNNKSRMFCIDLCPRLLYSNGEMVDLLVKSNVSRYHEFKNNIRILSMIGEEIHAMPCRRSDVFTSPLLSDLVDKRRLMKFVEICIQYDPASDTPETSEIAKHANLEINKFLTDRGLNPTLRDYIINSIAMVSPNDSTEEACKKIKQFMVATERFGKSPFLFPLYGCGEFPQSFCRLSAVFGGTYCLNTKVDSVKISTKEDGDESNVAIPPENFAIKFSNSNEEVKSDILVMDYNTAIELNLTNEPSLDDKLSRGIVITRKSVSDNSDNLISFMRIPPSDRNANLVYMLELNSSVMVCPPDMNIVYLWTKSTTDSAEDDLEQTVDRIFGDKSTVMWDFYFQQLTGKQFSLIKSDEVDSLHITSPPCDDIDYASSIKEAEQIFNKMCPNQEFLPRAPDPDEIIT